MKNKTKSTNIDSAFLHAASSLTHVERLILARNLRAVADALEAHRSEGRFTIPTRKNETFSGN
jgi:hypothetical protein